MHSVTYNTYLLPCSGCRSGREKPPGSQNWGNYRLGDVFKGNKMKGYIKKICANYPDSIACAYSIQTSKSRDIPAVVAVLKARGYKYRPGPSHVVVHLRLGDGLVYRARGKGSNPNCWEHEADCFHNSHHEPYAFQKNYQDYYRTVAGALVPGSIIIIVSDASHWTRPRVRGGVRTGDPRHGDWRVDNAYRASIASFFRGHGFGVRTRLKSTPDDDFAYVCGSRTFVQGGGGFSKLMGEVVAARGGKVFKPNPRK